MNPPDSHIGRYQLLRRLATGGMGEVFLARSAGPAGFSKMVVVKRILRHLSAEASFVEMFLNEARLAALLSHPNIVQIFELGEEDGTYFIVMEYVHGLSLHALTRKLRELKLSLAPELAAYVCMQALQGLQYAHSLRDGNGMPMGIVHRDVTPDNLLVGFDGVVKVADFGIAKATTTVPTTAAGTVKGKFAYLSPEQIQALPLDERADLFAMGVVLYSLLAGRLPFLAASDAATMHAVLHQTPADLREANPKVSLELAAVVEQALEKDPTRRFPSAEAMAGALEGVLAHSPTRIGQTAVSRFLRERLPDDALRPPPTADHPVQSLPSRHELPTVQQRTPSVRQLHSPASAPSEVVEVTFHDSRRPWLLFALGIGLSAALGAIGFLTVQRHPANPEAPAAVPGAALVKAEAHALVPGVEPAAGMPPAQGRLAPPAAPSAAPAAEAAVSRSGRVEVRVNPWAEVYLEGKKVGVTPMRPLSIRAGTHLFTLRNPELGVERKVRVQVLPGRLVTLKADMLE